MTGNGESNSLDAALMEYHCSDDKLVASRIFEKGLYTFGDEIEFVLRYLGFLISTNDENNARALFEWIIGTFPPERARPLWERWARYKYQYGDLEGALKLEKRIAEVYPTDPPIKRFAQRHIYLGTDAIAARDLGFAMARKVNTSALGRTETQTSLQSGTTPAPSAKRPSSPDYRNRDDSRSGEYSQGYKRMQAVLPARGGGAPPERDRESRWDGPSFSPPPPAPPPAWEREEGGRPSLPTPRGHQMDREEEKPRSGSLPPVLLWFLGELPTPASFDGPVFRTDDLMNLFRNAVIPSSNRVKSPPPNPPPRSGGRPPPDYSPYQGQELDALQVAEGDTNQITPLFHFGQV